MNIYVASEEFVNELEHELGDSFTKLSDTFYLCPKKIDSIWAQDIWYDVSEIHFESISEAVKKLKKINSHWLGYSLEAHRRCKLIQEQINFYKKPKLQFLKPLPKQTFQCFLMIDQNKILASSSRKHPLPDSEIVFEENKTIPPSRAYLKLWELFTVHGICPKPGETCLDLGSSPGGWSWVLSELGANVISVDKAPLDDKISQIKNITSLKKDAFELKPDDVGAVDWLFSDIICEPKRLLRLIETWQKAGVRQFVCTLKFKGDTDFEIIEKFRGVKGSRLYHLYHNKHEITWVLKKT